MRKLWGKNVINLRVNSKSLFLLWHLWKINGFLGYLYAASARVSSAIVLAFLSRFLF
jgi:hypothetical protein